jgi:hypothetical protein
MSIHNTHLSQFLCFPDFYGLGVSGIHSTATIDISSANHKATCSLIFSFVVIS